MTGNIQIYHTFYLSHPTSSYTHSSDGMVNLSLALVLRWEQTMWISLESLRYWLHRCVHFLFCTLLLFIFRLWYLRNDNLYKGKNCHQPKIHQLGIAIFSSYRLDFRFLNSQSIILDFWILEGLDLISDVFFLNGSFYGFMSYFLWNSKSSWYV